MSYNNNYNNNNNNNNAVVVKTYLQNDLRRFSIEDKCTWDLFVGLVSKLYDIDASSFKITYKDEEGDDLSLTTTEELQEGIRLARLMTPPLLRLTLSRCGSVVASSTTAVAATTSSPRVPQQQNQCGSTPSKSVFLRDVQDRQPLPPAAMMVKEIEERVVLPQDDLPIVYVAGKAFRPPTVTKPTNYGCTKVPKPALAVPTDVTESLPSSSSQPEVPITITSPTTYTPYRVSNAFSTLTSSMSDSLSQLMVESSEFTLQLSSAASAATAHNTDLISSATAASNFVVSSQTSSRAQLLSRQSISDTLESTIQQLSQVANDTQKTSSDASMWATSKVCQTSSLIQGEVEPISKQTMKLQSDAVVGLEEGIDKDVDEVVRSIMAAAASTSAMTCC